MNIIITYLILTLAFLISFNKSVAQSEDKKVKMKSSVELESKIKIDTVTESRFAYLREIDNLDSTTIVKVDYVDYLTGKEAADAEWRDKAYFIDGEDTITNITDGYYISNINPKLRTFKLKHGISVEHIIDGDGVQEMHKPKELDSKQIETYIEYETLLFLHIEKGIIKRIDEIFMP